MASAEARTALLASAERLFAEEGIDAVSLRQINLAAGQRNVAAAHYHFGSKEGLIEAILARRIEQINARRLELLAELEEAGRESDLAAVVETLLRPLAELLDGDPAGRHYLRLLAQVWADPRVGVAELVRGPHGRSVRRIEELVHAILRDLPREVVALRLTLATSQMIHALADWVLYWRGQEDQSGAAYRPFYVSALVDAMVGSLSAPVSATTLRELRA